MLFLPISVPWKLLKCIGSDDTWRVLDTLRNVYTSVFSCLPIFAHPAQLEILFLISENPNPRCFSRSNSYVLILPSRSWSIFFIFLCHCVYDFVMVITPFCFTLQYLCTVGRFNFLRFLYESSYRVQIFWMWGSHFIFLSYIVPILGYRIVSTHKYL